MTSETREKRFVLIGGYGGGPTFMSAKELVGCYGLHQEECILASSEAMVRGMDTTGKILLRPRALNDYREALSVILNVEGNHAKA